MTCGSAFAPKENTCTGPDGGLHDRTQYCNPHISDSATCTTEPRIDSASVTCVFTAATAKTAATCTTNIPADAQNCNPYNSDETTCTVRPRTDDIGGTCVFVGSPPCSKCSNDGTECCIPIRNCAYTWNPWSTCHPSQSNLAVEGDNSGVESERQCTDQCSSKPPQYSSLYSCVWTEATANSPYRCEYNIAANQRREVDVKLTPQGGGTECPDLEMRRCKVDVSVEPIPISYIICMFILPRVLLYVLYIYSTTSTILYIYI